MGRDSRRARARAGGPPIGCSGSRRKPCSHGPRGSWRRSGEQRLWEEVRRSAPPAGRAAAKQRRLPTLSVRQIAARRRWEVGGGRRRRRHLLRQRGERVVALRVLGRGLELVDLVGNLGRPRDSHRRGAERRTSHGQARRPPRPAPPRGALDGAPPRWTSIRNRWIGDPRADGSSGPGHRAKLREPRGKVAPEVATIPSVGQLLGSVGPGRMFSRRRPRAWAMGSP